MNDGWRSMPLTAAAIRLRLKQGCVVEVRGGLVPTAWRRIAAVRTDRDGPLWRGLWVQEYGGLCAWFSPKDGARYRRTA